MVDLVYITYFLEPATYHLVQATKYLEHTTLTIVELTAIRFHNFKYKNRT